VGKACCEHRRLAVLNDLFEQHRGKHRVAVLAAFSARRAQEL
jgi:hypothetical protein